MHKSFRSTQFKVAIALGALGIFLLGALVLFNRTFQSVDTNDALFRLIEKHYQIQHTITAVFYGDNIEKRLHEERKLLSRDVEAFQNLLDVVIRGGSDLKFPDYLEFQGELLNLEEDWRGLHSQLMNLIDINTDLQKTFSQLIMRVNGKWISDLNIVERRAWGFSEKEVEAIGTLKNDAKVLRNAMYHLNAYNYEESVAEESHEIQEQLQNIQQQLGQLRGESPALNMIISSQEEFEQVAVQIAAFIKDKRQVQEGVDVFWKALPKLLQQQNELFKALGDKIQDDIQSFRTSSQGIAVVMILVIIGLYLIIRSSFFHPLASLTKVLKQLSMRDVQDYRLVAKEVRSLSAMRHDTEVGELARAVYEVLLKLEDKTLEIEEHNKKAAMSSLARTQLLTNIFHELKTPLNTIMGYSELLADETEDLSVDIREDVERIHKSSRQLHRAVENMLNLSKVEQDAVRLDPTTFNLSSLIGDVVEVITPLIQERENTIEVSLPKIEATLCTDLPKMQQILMNLLSTALKYTERGTITLSMSYPENEEKGRIVISIKGVGKGMMQEQLRMVLGLDRGADLGLLICREFLSLMKGDISLERNEDGTMEFLITLPVSIESSPTQKESLTL